MPRSVKKILYRVIKLLLLSVLLMMIVTVISCQDKVNFCLCSFTELQGIVFNVALHKIISV